MYVFVKEGRINNLYLGDINYYYINNIIMYT
jgi:hypothetical protein